MFDSHDVKFEFVLDFGCVLGSVLTKCMSVATIPH